MVTGPKQPEGQLGAVERGGVSRRNLVIFTGAAGLTAALVAACSGNNYPEEPASPSTANIPMQPKPAETTKPAEIILPDPTELISIEQMEKAFTFPNWQEELDKVKEKGDSEKGLGDVIAEFGVKAFTFLTNATSHIDKATVEQIRQANLEEERLEVFASKLQEYVTDGFVKAAIADPTQGNIPAFLAWMKERGAKNIKLSLNQCGSPRALSKDMQFYRDFKLIKSSGGGRSSTYTNFPKPSQIIRDEFYVSTDCNLNPDVCKQEFEGMHPDDDRYKIRLDFKKPMKDDYSSPLIISDASIEPHWK